MPKIFRCRLCFLNWADMDFYCMMCWQSRKEAVMDEINRREMHKLLRDKLKETPNVSGEVQAEVS